MIKRINLSDNEVHVIDFNADGNNPGFYISNPYCFVRAAFGGIGIIIASSTRSDLKAHQNVDLETDVAIVGSDSCRLELNSSNKIYLIGEGECAWAEIYTTNCPESPWARLNH